MDKSSTKQHQFPKNSIFSKAAVNGKRKGEFYKQTNGDGNGITHIKYINLY